MAEIHFLSIEASQSKTDVTKRLGDNDFILAICTYSLRNSDRFEVIRDFISFKYGGVRFPVDGSIAEEK
jgi:hypothetical protein